MLFDNTCDEFGDPIGPLDIVKRVENKRMKDREKKILEDLDKEKIVLLVNDFQDKKKQDFGNRFKYLDISKRKYEVT